MDPDFADIIAQNSPLENILNSFADGVILLNDEDKIMTFNLAAEQITGMISAEACGKTLAEIFDPLGHKSFDNDATALSALGPNTSLEIQLALPYNDTRHVRFSMAPMISSAGYPGSRVVTLQDVTQVKKLQEQANRTGRLAAMGEMAVKIAHEIRNPLGSIELFASLLRKDLEADEDKKMITEHISSGVRSINNIISNLLLFIRPEQQPEMQVLDLHNPLKDSLFFAEHMISSNSSINLVTHFAPRSLEINGDAQLLSQVALNLILNAIQAMPDGGQLTISTRQAPDSNGHEIAEIRFADTGCGIPQKNMASIFDPFFTTKKKGTGLGLAIVHNIIKAHSGSIDIKSSPANGTECIVAFPLWLPAEGQKCKPLTE